MGEECELGVNMRGHFLTGWRTFRSHLGKGGAAAPGPGFDDAGEVLRLLHDEGEEVGAEPLAAVAVLKMGWMRRAPGIL